MQIMRPAVLLAFLVRAAFGLHAFSERDSHPKGFRDAPRHELQAKATLLRTAVSLRRHAHASQKASLHASQQRAGANITLDDAGDKLDGVLDEVKQRMSQVRTGLDKLHTVCVDLTSRVVLRSAFQRQEMEQFQLAREANIQETAMRKAKLEYLVKSEADAQTSYDSSVAQRAQEMDEYLDTNKSLVDQKIVFAKVLDLLNEKKALVTAPKNYSENFSYVPASVVTASSMDYVIGVIQNLQKTAATKSTEEDSKFETSDKGLATLVSSFKASLQHVDEQYQAENARKLEAELAAQHNLEEKNYRSLFISGEEGVNDIWSKVCGDTGSSASLSGCWFSDGGQDAPSDKPFTLTQSGDFIYTQLDGEKGQGSFKDGKVSFEWPNQKLAEVPIHKIWWTRVSASDCSEKLESKGFLGKALTDVDSSLSEFEGIVATTLMGMDSLPMVSTDLLQTKAAGARNRPRSDVAVDRKQLGAQTAASRRDELLRLAREVQMRSTRPEVPAVPVASLKTRSRPAKPLLRIAERPKPFLEPSLEDTMADAANVAGAAFHLLLGVNGYRRAGNATDNSTGNDNSMDAELAACMSEKQAETDKIVIARQALRVARSQNVTATIRLANLDSYWNTIDEQKKMLSDHSADMTAAFETLLVIEQSQAFTNAMASAIQEMDAIKTEVSDYINAGGPPAASAVLTSIDTIKARLGEMKTNTETDMSQLMTVEGNELLLKYHALDGQLAEKMSLDLVPVIQNEEKAKTEALTEIAKQDAALQAAITTRTAVEYRCQAPGSCGILNYQQCCGVSDGEKFDKLVSTWDDCTKHCEATLAAGHAVVGCEMASNDKSSPGLCSAVTKCTLAAENRTCAGSRCKPAHLAIGQS